MAVTVKCCPSPCADVLVVDFKVDLLPLVVGGLASVGRASRTFVIEPFMSPGSTLLSCLLALLMVIQPLNAALRDCCCSQRAPGMQAPQSVPQPTEEKASGQCPRCRAMAKAQADDAATVPEQAVRRSCGCDKTLKTMPVVTRRTVLRMLDENVPLPRLESLASGVTTDRTLRLLRLDSVRRSGSGREIRLKHCSWLA